MTKAITTRLAPLIALAALAACGEAEQPVPQGNDAASPSAIVNQAAPAPAPAPVEPAASEAQVLTSQGYDTIRIGAKPGEVGHGLKDDGNYQDVCRIWLSDQLPGLAVLVEDGLIRRVTLYTGPRGPSPIRTERGIGVGSTEAEVRAAYSPLGEEAHKYSEAPAKNLYWGEEGVPQALRFEIAHPHR